MPPTLTIHARQCRRCGSTIWPDIRSGEPRWTRACPAVIDGRQCNALRWSEPAESIPRPGPRPMTPAQRAERLKARAQARAIEKAAGLGNDAVPGLG